MKTKCFLPIAAAGVLLVACNRSPSPAPQNHASLGPDALARVEGQTIRLSDFQAELERRAHGRSDAFSEVKERESLLREMVNFESVYLRAKAAGFDQRPEIARQLKALVVDRYLEEQLRNQPELPAVSETEIADYYRQHAAQFSMPAKVRFAAIKLGFSPKASDEKKAEVLSKAEQVLAEARAANSSANGFATLAQRYSEDQATRYLGGDAGSLARGEGSRWDKTVVDAVFALAAPGDFAPVIKTSDVCYIIKLIERNDAGQRPLAEVAAAIRYQLAVQKRHQLQQEVHEAMTAGLEIEINRPLLESLPTPPGPGDATPPALPGS